MAPNSREYQREYMRKWVQRPGNRQRKRDIACQSRRKIWQRQGSGAHAANVQDWERYFDSLQNDSARTEAAFVLLEFASFDRITMGVVHDPSFDYNYIAAYTE